VDSVTDVFDGDTIAQNNGVSEIGTIARLLGENADQIQVLPQRIKQVVKVQLHFATDDDGMWLPCKSIHFFQWDLINLVVDVEAGQIFSVAFDHVN